MASCSNEYNNDWKSDIIGPSFWLNFCSDAFIGTSKFSTEMGSHEPRLCEVAQPQRGIAGRRVCLEQNGQKVTESDQWKLL